MATRGDGAQGKALRSKVISIIGTRPEAIKMAPVADVLAASKSIDHSILLTGQHSGIGSILKRHLCFELDAPLCALDFAGQRDLMRRELVEFLSLARPDLVLVQGDTTSAQAGALATSDCGIAIAHVEAGLRSHDREPWPEEDNRIRIDALSSLLFAPTRVAAANLANEDSIWGIVQVTGNSGIDVLFALAPAPATATSDAARKRLLVTCHRRENQGPTFDRICVALRDLVQKLPVRIRFLLHPNPPLAAAACNRLASIEHIDLVPALTHEESVAMLRTSWALLTDSGGLQEYGAALGVPVLVLRDVTERVEAPSNIELVGSEPARIIDSVRRLIEDEDHYSRMAIPSTAFGDGQSARRIGDHVESWLHAHATRANPGQRTQADVRPIDSTVHNPRNIMQSEGLNDASGS